eukprot:XP_001706164.1 Hypothetical protein GL50803_39086 [Giardia lamblia ATCC 50803]
MLRCLPCRNVSIRTNVRALRPLLCGVQRGRRFQVHGLSRREDAEVRRRKQA